VALPAAPQRRVDLRRKQVAADGDVAARFGARRRLLHDAGDVQAVFGQRHHAVAFQVGRIVLDGQHAAAGPLVGVDQLARERRLADVQVIGEHDHERGFTRERLGQQDRLAGAEHPLLPQEEEPARRHGDRPLLVIRALRFEHLLQLHLAVDVVFQGALAARGDEQDVLDSGIPQLL